VRVSHEAFQATDLSPTPGAGAAAPAAVAASPESKPTTARDPDKVGIVFVHGIGTQRPAETFLDWSSAIVRMLQAWRVEQGFGVDPVVRSQFAFSPSALPFLELDIAAWRGRAATTWVVTEALWAEAVRPPNLDTAAWYLRDRLWTIVRGIRSGYLTRERPRARRLTATIGAAAAKEDPPDVAARVAELRPQLWRWIPFVEWLQRSVMTQWLVVVPVVALATLLLALWAPLRRIPIGPLQDWLEAKLVDSFLTDWFGDLPVLLDDPVQAANVRARVAETVTALEAQGCGSIVLIAHSGGAIVAFETLLDAAYLPGAARGMRVDKLITHGEALKLGWRLAGAEDHPLERGSRLTGALGKARPDLRWVDVWASFDPAPAGPLPENPPQGVALAVAVPGDPPVSGRDAADGVLVVESRPVTNLMSLTNDHGGYWDNDEGFLVPLLRHVDDARGVGRDSRFYALDALRTVRIERRRQRVAVLAAWWWLTALAAIVAIVVGGLVAGAPRIAGTTLIAIWERVPGHELVSAPLDAVWGALGAVLALFGRNTLADSLPSIGPVLVGAFVIGGLFALINAIGRSAWSRWDVAEREAARLERLPPLDRRFAIGGFITAIATLISVTVASFDAGDGARVALILGTGIVLGVAIAALVVGLLPRPPEFRDGRTARTTEPTTATHPPAATTATAAEPPTAVEPTAPPAPGTRRTRPAARRTSRQASRTSRRSG
jgi:hypothetical protein